VSPFPGLGFGVDGRLIDLILGLMVAEMIVILALRRRAGKGPRLALLLPNMAAGGFLLLSLREALVGASSLEIAVCLLCALVAHLFDLRARWRS
jgi:hypothetical protein